MVFVCTIVPVLDKLSLREGGRLREVVAHGGSTVGGFTLTSLFILLLISIRVNPWKIYQLGLKIKRAGYFIEFVSQIFAISNKK